MIPTWIAMVAASVALVPSNASQMTTVRAQAIAQAAWGLPPSCQPVVTRAPLPTDTLADALTIGCRVPTIVFTTTHKWDWITYCSAMVHEYGHKAGMVHSYNRRSVMFPSGATWKFCVPRRLWADYAWTTQRAG